MKVKCPNCFGTTDITIDRLIFENEDEKMFVAYLTSEMSKEEKKKTIMNIKCTCCNDKFVLSGAYFTSHHRVFHFPLSSLYSCIDFVL